MLKKSTKKSHAKQAFAKYYEQITYNCAKNMPIIITHKNNKSTDLNLKIPTYFNYSDILCNKYTIQQLKSIASHYKLTICGNKHQLICRIYCALYLTNHAIKLQHFFKNMLIKKYNICRGPALLKRSLCVNSEELITMDSIYDIPYEQFISYTDIDGFTYGFDISSLYNIFIKSKNKTLNPYNRTIIPNVILKNMQRIICLSNVMNIHVKLSYCDNVEINTTSNDITTRAISLFNNINELGHYADYKWFIELHYTSLMTFMMYLIDIWSYRANILPNIKCKICPQNGNPFININIEEFRTMSDYPRMQLIVITVLEKMVNQRVKTEYRSLGALYILGALTMTSQSAADSLPYLYTTFKL